MDVSETLFQAVDILIDKKIEAVKFDKTIEATVENANNANNGQYTVSSGAAKFIAYSYDTQYKENDVVLVTIPQGNFDNQKIIIGKKVSEMNESMGYQSPFQNFINISNNLITTQTFFTPMQANSHNTDYTWPIEETNFTVLDYIWCADYSNTPLQGYTRLGLQAQFLTYLADYNTTSGNYGLALKITFQEISSGKIQSSFVFLDSNSFLGNPYNFETYYTQEEVFDISAFKEYPIVRLDLYQYQRDNFKDNEGQFIPSSTEDDFSSIPSNIFIKDIMICVGYPVENFKNDIAELYTENTLTYDKNYNYYSYYISAPRNNTTALYLQRGGVLYWSTTEPDKDSDLVLYTGNWMAFQTDYISQSKPGYFYKKKISDQIENGAIFITPERVKHNKKIVQLRWIHKNNDGVIKALTYDDHFDTEYEIRWYRHHLGAASPDEFAGAHWDRFYGVAAAANDNEDWTDYSFIPIQFSEDNINSTNGEYKRFVTYTPILEESEEDEYGNTHWEEVGIDIDTIKFSVTGATTVYEIKNGKWILVQAGEQTELDKIYYLKTDNVSSYPEGYDIATNQLQIEFIPNVNYQTEQLKAIILEKINDNSYKKLIETNVLTFTNNTQVSNPATILDMNALSIRYDDDEKGHYFLYDEAGDIGKNEDSEIRILTAVFDSTTNNIYEKAELTNYTHIKWTFPSGSTMIIPMTNVTKDAIPSNEVIFEDVVQVGFAIKAHLNNGATNNTIQLDVLKDGINYHAFIQPVFGTAGDNGSDYKLILTWRDGKNALNLSPNFDHTLIGDVILFDQAGDIVDWPENATLKADWLVAEVAGETLRQKEVETANYFYPVFKSDDQILYYYDGNDSIQDKGYQPSGYYYFRDDSEQVNAQYYYYNVNAQEFELTDFNYSGQLYRKKLKGETKNKLEYRKVIFSSDPLNQETGEIQHTDPPIGIDNENKKTYGYSVTKRYFVKINDQYILDPWDDYQEAETYFEPIEAKEKVYSYDNEGKLVGANNKVLNASVNDHIVTITADDAVDINSLFILRLTLSNFGDYDLVAYYPIALKNGEIKNGQQETKIIQYIEGPDRVRYSSAGEADFNKNPYQISTLIYEGNNLIKYRHGYDDSDKLDGYWRLLFINDNNEENTFKPVLKETGRALQNGYDLPLLSPISVYIPDALPYGVQFLEPDTYELITSSDEYNEINEVYNSSNELQNPKPQSWSENTYYKRVLHPLWTQPILVYENKYPSATLNKWNGKDIETDNDAGTITASGFAAGRKERDNTFTGVVMGDWSRTSTETAVTKNTGIYGFNHGTMSYAFKDDGTGFIGKDGGGRLFFDGEKSQIFSSGWVNQNNPQGMLLDIDDGYIKMESIDENSEVYTQVLGDIEKKYFNSGQNSNTLNPIYRGILYKDGTTGKVKVQDEEQYSKDTKYYLKESGTRYITIGANQPNTPLSIGTEKNISLRRFRVDWDGKIHVIDGDFSGSISGSTISGGYISGSTISGSVVHTTELEAYKGNVGGWTIREKTLSGGGTILDSKNGITTNTVTIKNSSDNLGQLGLIIGSDGSQPTYNIGIKSGETKINNIIPSIVLESENNIRLSAAKGTVHIDGETIKINNENITDYIKQIIDSDYITRLGFVKSPNNDSYALQSSLNGLIERVEVLERANSSSDS